MALVRILVDGYSMLHGCPEIAAGLPRHSSSAREELIHLLTQYRDVIGTPITVFFDGAGAPPGTMKTPSAPEMEILFSKAGQTADDMIERAAYRFKPYGEVLAVTDDHAERETVLSLGGLATSCGNFLREIESALEDLAGDVLHHNRRELSRFRGTGA